MGTVHIKEVSNETLLDYLANAKVTTSRLSIHHRSYPNREALVRKYTNELESRGVKIPDDKDLYRSGVFNGRGSY